MNLRPPSFKPLRFVPASKKDEILDKDVFWVDAVAHERLPQGGNHWCFYLRVSATHLIHLDMTPSYTVPSTSIAGGSKGNLVVSLLDYTISPSAQKVVRLDVLTGRTVRDYVSLLVEHGRDKYEFNDQGQGCRYWVDQQIDLLGEPRANRRDSCGYPHTVAWSDAIPSRAGWLLSVVYEVTALGVKLVLDRG